MRCPACSRDAPDGSRYCPSCARPFDAVTSAPTETSLQGEAEATPLTSRDGARFLPGTVLARRYRIIALLGRGGMGEVYRAEDLKLGQPVALKFLPQAAQRDAARLDRFRNEARVALKVTHPNVCRVHDIGEAGGQHFLSMEYVDGEDLASLLRRIERPPRNKAVQIARQLCAGLAASHEQGILHRDLKPANVMIDGRGRAKITDFGLAGLAEGIEGQEIRAGTPGYMAPEQLEGAEVTVRSDLFSLGMVLYELFTGKRAFEARTAEEMMRLRKETSPTSPSSHVEGLDPAVERVILRCLEAEPDRRPESALAVAAALPGGEPLAAALAAGETPSPGMVADAGETGGLRPVVGLGLLILILVGLVGLAANYGSFYATGRIPLDLPPEVLTVKARELLTAVGADESPVDRVHGFEYDQDYLEYVRAQEPSTSQWDDLETVRPSPIVFWYRQSSDYLITADYYSAAFTAFVTSEDPPWVTPGMSGVWLDPQGRLLRFRAVPPHLDATDLVVTDLDWSVLFEAAGLDPEAFGPAQPVTNPLLDCDSRFAWTGAYNEQPEVPLRVEAGVYRGRPAYFEIITPWRERGLSVVETGRSWADDLFWFVLLMALMIGGPLLARRNVHLGRGDRRGALRLASFVFWAQGLWWLLRVDHVPGYGELWLFFQFLGYNLVASGLVWVVYMALEPYARRLWPVALVSWNRLLDGRFRDPLVGRDVLLGACVGMATRHWWSLYPILLERFSLAGNEPNFNSLVALTGVRHAMSQIVDMLAESLYIPIMWFFVLLLLRVLLRSLWAAAAVIMFFVSASMSVGDPNPVLISVFIAVPFGAFIFLLIRFGLLPAVFWAMFMFAGEDVVLTLDPSVWYAGRSLALLLVLAALACYGFYTSLAGRPLMRDSLLKS